MVREARGGDLGVAVRCEHALLVLAHPSLACPTPTEAAAIILRVHARHDIMMLRAAFVKE